MCDRAFIRVWSDNRGSRGIQNGPAMTVKHPIDTDPADASSAVLVPSRRECDAYLIEVLRALDERIERVSSTIERVPDPESARHRAASGLHEELTRRLIELRSARAGLLDVMFRHCV